MDGGLPRSLAACDPPPPPTLEGGGTYACTLTDVATPGAHRNVVTATLTHGDLELTLADPAHYFAVLRAVTVDKAVSSDGTTWFNASLPADYPRFDIDTPLWWRVAVTNTSNVTVSLYLTDTLDGTPLPLPTRCEPPPPPQLTTPETSGASYTCLLTDTAAEGEHQNVVTATVTYGAGSVTASTRAGYVGRDLNHRIYLPLVLRKP